MKKKILGLVACLGIAFFFAINISINLSNNHLISKLSLKNIEALADGEGGGSIGTYYQIIAGCRNYAMSNWVNRCCKGSSVSCKHDRCNYQIVEGCDKFGRVDI